MSDQPNSVSPTKREILVIAYMILGLGIVVGSFVIYAAATFPPMRSADNASPETHRALLRSYRVATLVLLPLVAFSYLYLGMYLRKLARSPE